MKKLLFIGALGTACATMQAEVTLPAIYTSNMVIQQKSEMTLHGTATPGSSVSLQAGWTKKDCTTTADAQGRWTMSVKTPKAGGPYRMTFSDGTATTLDNVMVGEVWFCSGQSNMEMPVAGWGEVMNFRQEVEAAHYPNIRLYQVKKTTAIAPQDEAIPTMGGWQECSPTTVAEFSSLGYFYARALWQDMKVPVGVIDCTWGGTPAEAWTSSGSIKEVMGYEQQMAQLEAIGFDMQKAEAAYQKEMEVWKAQIFKIDQGYTDGRECWVGTDYDDADWSTMQLPSYWESQGLGGFDGIVWFRKTVDLPTTWAGREIKLNVGMIDDEDIVYWNGREIARGAGYNSPRHYSVPASEVKAGRNVISIRVADNGGEGGIAGLPEELNLSCTGQKTIALSGAWRYKVGCSLQSMPPSPMYPGSASYPTTLYNAMVHPWITYPIKGVIWYQGEANIGRATQYESLFQALIQDWRKQFGNAEMPFYFVQIANFMERQDIQPESPWAAIRDAQAQALHLNHTGMVTNIDLGEAYNIHPKNKQEVARRLAALALADTYGKKCAGSAPVYAGYEVNGREVRVRFDMPRIAEALEANAHITGFTVAGPDHKFHKAEAHTDGNSVVVTCPEVTMPVAVRYGWADNPECNLHTPSGLYVSPFRSDNW